MQHLGGQFLGGANGGLTPQQAAALQQASSFPFPASAHMLGLAGFGNLSQQLNGANGLGGGFGPRKIDIKVPIPHAHCKAAVAWIRIISLFMCQVILSKCESWFQWTEWIRCALLCAVMGCILHAMLLHTSCGVRVMYGSNGADVEPAHAFAQDGLSGDVAALKRAAAVSGMKPEDVLKLGLPSMTTPEAAARLHALGVPSAMLNGRQPPNGHPPAMTMAGFHEQLLAAAAQQRPESQGISLLR